MFFNSKILLASKSKSREKIFKQIGLQFIKKRPICNEEKIKKKHQKETPKKLSMRLATAKAKSLSSKNKNILIVGSDTVVSIKGKIINKSKNITAAKKTIKKLSGKNHLIFSSAAVCFNEKIVWTGTQKSTVKIRKLSEDKINTYLKRCGKKIIHSVGCYQIENKGPNIIEDIKGDFFNVMGFPLFPFLMFLKKFKIKQ